MGIPKKYILKYTVAICKISGSHPINFKKSSEQGTPIASKIIPAISAKSIDVPTVFLAPSISRAPTYLARTTLEPIENATNKFTSNPLSAEFAPTAATASSPTKIPKTAISAVLNNICSMFANMNGIE